MNRRVAWIIVATVLTSVLFASVTTSGGVNLWREPQLESTPREREPVQRSAPSAPSESPPPVVADEPVGTTPGWVDVVVRVVLTVLAIGGAIALAMAGWRHRPRVRWRRRPSGPTDFDVLPDVAAAIVDEAASQRAALLTGEPRNAIVRCWLQLENDVAAVGLTRHPADTSAEFTARVVGQYTVDPDAIDDLAALYREARFSRHPIDESARRAALDALDRLHVALGDVSAADSADADRPPVGAPT